MWIPLFILATFSVFWLSQNMPKRQGSPIAPPSPAPAQNPVPAGAAPPPANAPGQPGSTPAPATRAIGYVVAIAVGLAVVILVVLGLTWLGQPKAVVETPAAAAFKHGFEVKVAAGPWRKVEEVDWAKVKSTFTIPAKGNIHCDQAVNAGKRLHYAIRQPDGVIIEMKPLGEQSPEDKKQEVTAPVGAVVQVTSLTGEELSLLIQY